MEALSFSLRSPLLRTGTVPTLYRYSRLSRECFGAPHSLPKGQRGRQLMLETGRDGNYDNAAAHEASLPLKELEMRRGISETKKAQEIRAWGEGNDDIAPQEASIPWKELERRRKISETKKAQGRISWRLETSGEVSIPRKELERRRKISEAKKGCIPWNTGKKIPPETRKKISQRMVEILSDPKVRKAIRKGMPGKHSEKSKQLMSASHKRGRAESTARRIIFKREQERYRNYWAQIIAINAKLGGYGEKELDWDEYAKIKAQMRSEEIAAKSEKIIEKNKIKARKEILARIKANKSTKGRKKKREDETGTTAQIKANYGTPFYNRTLKARLSKLYDRKKKLERSSKSKEVVPETRQTSDEWDIEVIKERLEIGASLSDQLELVRNRKNVETNQSE